MRPDEYLISDDQLAGQATMVAEATESLNRSIASNALLTDAQLELLGSITVLTIGMVFLPELAAVIVGESVLLSILGMSAALGLGTPVAMAPIFALDVLGLTGHREQDTKVIQLAAKLTGNAFSLIGGTIGAAVDGQYGLEVGATAGQYANFIAQFSPNIQSIVEAKGAYKITMHSLDFIKGIIDEFPADAESEHINPGQHLWATHLSGSAIADDMAGHFPGHSQPTVSSITEPRLSTNTEVRIDEQRITDIELYEQISVPRRTTNAVPTSSFIPRPLPNTPPQPIASPQEPPPWWLRPPPSTPSPPKPPQNPTAPPTSTPPPVTVTPAAPNYYYLRPPVSFGGGETSVPTGEVTSTPNTNSPTDIRNSGLDEDSDMRLP